MTRILLADDSPHAQRMGERILRDEGYQVVTVSDGETALLRLADADPDLVIADVYLPGRSGYEICAQIKADPRHKHAKVILTAGLLERVDDVKAAAAGSDLILKKPFEASVVLAAIRPLIEMAQAGRKAAQQAAPDAAAAAAAAAAGGDTGAVVAAAPAALEAQAPEPATFVTIAPAAIDMPVPEAEKPAAAAPAAVDAQAPETSAAAVEPPAFEVDAERVRAAVTLALDRAMPALIDELTERVLIALGK